MEALISQPYGRDMRDTLYGSIDKLTNHEEHTVWKL